MKISDLIKMGLRNLFRRKARTALTIIGMVIGTISIVVMSSIGVGINNVFTEAVMKNGGLSLIYVYPKSSYDMDGKESNTKIAEMNDELIDQIKAIDKVRSVSPVYDTFVQLQCGKYSSYMSISVMDYATADDFGYPLLSDGSRLTKDDYQKIIIPSYVLENFRYWAGRNVKTKTVDLKKDKVTAQFQEYQLNENKKPFTFSINDNYGQFVEEENSQYSWQAYMDIDYYKELYKKYANTLKNEDRKKALKSLETYAQLYVNVDDIREVSGVVEKINDLGVMCYSAMTELDPMIETADMLQMVFGAIGAIAMLVSAINIANTMIMSIYERTKEIGVMKVLGCLIRDIKKLFLFEAGMIGFIGGCIGVGLSFLASWGVNKYGGPLLSAIIPGNGWYVDSTGAQFSQINFMMIVEAIGLSVIVAIVAGYIPARRATKISAIEAMKTEG